MIDWICSENLLMLSRKLLMIMKSFHEVVFDVVVDHEKFSRSCFRCC